MCCYQGAGLTTTSANGVNLCFCNYQTNPFDCPSPCNYPFAPCLNGATCRLIGSTSYACTCAPNYSGTTCATYTGPTGGNTTNANTTSGAVSTFIRRCSCFSFPSVRLIVCSVWLSCG